MAEKAIASLTQMENPYPPEPASLYLYLGELHLLQGDHSASFKYLHDARTILQVFL
jgi:hypothetical protein